MSPLDEQAVELVTDLARLGAQLRLSTGGAAGWTWNPRQERQRQRIQDRLAQEDTDAPGFALAMVKAIQKRQRKEKD